MVKILICEDDLMTQKAIEHRLRADGYALTLASDGKEARNFLTADDYDLVLSDIHMSHLTGLDLIAYVRNELRKNMPIILLTRVGLDDTILKAFELGADDYITKPFNPDELSVRIKKQLMRLRLI